MGLSLDAHSPQLPSQNCVPFQALHFQKDPTNYVLPHLHIQTLNSG